MTSFEQILKNCSQEIGLPYEDNWYKLLARNGFGTVESLKEVSQRDWMDLDLPLRLYKVLSTKGYFGTPISGPPKPKPLSNAPPAAKKPAPTIEKLFSEFDTDHSGSIDTHELRTSIEKLGVVLDHENSLLLLKRVDRNNDSKIGFDEFKEMVALVQDIKDKFDSIDVDGSHNININELTQFFKTLGYNFPASVVQDFAKIFDEDNSGTLEYQEFFNLTLYLREMMYQYESAKQYYPDSITETLLGHQRAQHKAVKRFIEKNPHPSFEDLVRLILELQFSGKKRVPAPKILAVRNRQPPTRAIPLSKAKQEESAQLRQSIKPTPVSSGKFEDSKFPPSDNFLPPSVRPRVSSWRRIDEISNNPQLFVGGVEEGDVVQGQLGDCWFVSALSVLAANGTGIIEDVFVEKNIQKGLFKCKFFKDGEWRLIEIDDRLPCGVDGKPVFARGKDLNEFWVPLIEKAYAKLHGGYQHLEGGSISDGLRDLAGEAVQTIYLDDNTVPEAKDHDLLWKKLVRNMKESFLMGCSFSSPVAKAEEATPHGLLLNHAYAVIDCQEVRGHRLIRVRNPWGSHEWNGDWSDGSSKWTPEIKKHFNYEFGDDGTFFMCFEDFVQHFNRVQILLLMTDDVGEVWKKYPFNSQWKGKSAGGCRNHSTWSNNPQYSLEVQQKSTVFISLSQPDLRLKQANKDDLYPALGVFAFKVKDTRYKALSCPPDQTVLQSSFITSRDISCEFEAEPGQKYIIIPCYFQAKLENPFSVTFYTQKDATVSVVDQEMKENALTGRWNSDNAGGCTNHATWRRNPMYSLTSSHAAKVIVSLEQMIEGDDNPFTIGLYIFKSETPYRVLTPFNPVIKPKFSNIPKTTAELELQPKTNYILMPCTFEPNKLREFRISIFMVDQVSGLQLDLQEALKWDHQEQLKSSWSGTSAGGCMNNKTWKSNPQFLIEIHGSSKPTTLLHVIVGVQGTGMAIGGHIFKSDAQGTLKEIFGNIDFVQGQTSLGSFSVPSSGGTTYLLLLPCTFEAGHNSPFTLDFFSSDKLSITKLG